MAEWTHRFCERCWFDGPVAGVEWPEERVPGVFHDGPEAGGYRLPTQVINPDTGRPDPGVCCGCGGLTITGIYIRADERDLLCLGSHDHPELWSRVQVMPT